MEQVFNDKMIGFYAPSELVDAFTAKCKAKSINKSEFFRKKMTEFLEE